MQKLWKDKFLFGSFLGIFHPERKQILGFEITTLVITDYEYYQNTYSLGASGTVNGSKHSTLETRILKLFFFYGSICGSVSKV